MNATNKDGHIWTGEIERENGNNWYMYQDGNGKPYQSREVPAYRIAMDNAQVVVCENGKKAIVPIVPFNQAGTAKPTMLAKREFLKLFPQHEKTLAKNFSYAGFIGMQAGAKSRFELVEYAVSQGYSLPMFCDSGLKVTQAEKQYFTFLENYLTKDKQ